MGCSATFTNHRQAQKASKAAEEPKYRKQIAHINVHFTAISALSADKFKN